jgi:N-formylglutamate deformylase
VELVRRYGDPARHRHGIQIEINRKLYMNEQTLDLDQAGYLRLTTDLKALVEQLMATDPRTL